MRKYLSYIIIGLLFSCNAIVDPVITISGQNISFNLIYRDESLAGGYNYNGNGTTAVNFKFVNKLEKNIIHDQGGIGEL